MTRRLMLWTMITPVRDRPQAGSGVLVVRPSRPIAMVLPVRDESSTYVGHTGDARAHLDLLVDLLEAGADQRPHGSTARARTPCPRTQRPSATKLSGPDDRHAGEDAEARAQLTREKLGGTPTHDSRRTRRVACGPCGLPDLQTRAASNAESTPCPTCPRLPSGSRRSPDEPCAELSRRRYRP